MRHIRSPANIGSSLVALALIAPTCGQEGPAPLTARDIADLAKFADLDDDRRDTLAAAVAAVFMVPAPYRLTKIDATIGAMQADALVRAEFAVDGAPGLGVRLRGRLDPAMPVRVVGERQDLARAKVGAALAAVHALHTQLGIDGFVVRSAQTFQPAGPGDEELTVDVAITPQGPGVIEFASYRLEGTASPPSSAVAVRRALKALAAVPVELGVAKRYRISASLRPPETDGEVHSLDLDCLLTEKGQQLLRLRRVAPARPDDDPVYEIEGVRMLGADAGRIARTVAPVLSEKVDVWRTVDVVQVKSPDGDLLVVALPGAADRALVLSDVTVFAFAFPTTGEVHTLPASVARCGVVQHPNGVRDVAIDIVGTTTTHCLGLRSRGRTTTVSLDGVEVR